MKKFLQQFNLTLFVLLSTSGCSNLFFYPMKPYIRTPADIGLEYQNVEFQSSDGTPLHGWWLPAKGKAIGTILYLHGNAENISTHIANINWLPEQGYNVFIFDYRGYGKSQGTTKIDGIISDAESAISTVLALPENHNNSVIVFGQSLGGAIAIYATAHTPERAHVKALVVESSFSSYRQIAREKFGSFWLTWPLQYPLSWTITDRYSPIKAIPEITPIPLLLIYGQNDRIVPAHHGLQLFEAAHEPKKLWLIPNGHHISAFTTPSRQQMLIDYLRSLP